MKETLKCELAVRRKASQGCMLPLCGGRAPGMTVISYHRWSRVPLAGYPKELEPLQQSLGDSGQALLFSSCSQLGSSSFRWILTQLTPPCLLFAYLAFAVSFSVQKMRYRLVLGGKEW